MAAPPDAPCDDRMESRPINECRETAFSNALAIFSGGWTIDDLECVCFGGAERIDLLDIFTSLLEKSLVQADAEIQGERRYRMLESIREFALDRIKSAGEWNAACRRHCSYFSFGGESRK